MAKDNRAIVVEASTIGFRPGDWPRDVRFGGQHYDRSRVEEAHGDVVAVHYIGVDGRILTVLND